MRVILKICFFFFKNSINDDTCRQSFTIRINKQVGRSYLRSKIKKSISVQKTVASQSANDLNKYYQQHAGIYTFTKIFLHDLVKYNHKQILIPLLLKQF